MRLGSFFGNVLGEVAIQEVRLQSADRDARALCLTWQTPACPPSSDIAVQVYANSALIGASERGEMTFQVPQSGAAAIFLIGIVNRQRCVAWPKYCDPAGALGQRTRLSWTAPSAADIDHYAVFWNGGSGEIDPETPIATIRHDPNVSAYTWVSPNPLADGTHRFDVVAVDRAGNAFPVGSGVDVSIASIPAPPSDLSIAWSFVTQRATLTWTESPTPSVDRYEVYADPGDGSGAINYENPLGSSGGTSFETDVLGWPGRYTFGVRAFTPTTGERNVTLRAELELDKEGQAVSSRPRAPQAVSAAPVSDGCVEIAWKLDRREATRGGRPLPTGFRIYSDGGSGEVAFDAPVGEVAATWPQDGMYAWESPPLPHGVVHRFVVRSVAGSVESDNTEPVDAIPDALSPGAVEELAGEVVW